MCPLLPPNVSQRHQQQNLRFQLQPPQQPLVPRLQFLKILFLYKINWVRMMTPYSMINTEQQKTTLPLQIPDLPQLLYHTLTLHPLTSVKDGLLRNQSLYRLSDYSEMLMEITQLYNPLPPQP